MNPRTRNRVLVIGGALILIALMLVCGPFEGRFGGDRSTTGELPPVAAGPPEAAETGAELAEAAAEGAAAGGAVGALGESGAPWTEGAAGEDARVAGLPVEAGEAEAATEAAGPDTRAGAALTAGTAAAAGAAATTAEEAGAAGAGAAEASRAAPLPPVSAGAPETAARDAVGTAAAAAAGAGAAARAFDEALAAEGRSGDAGGVGPAGPVVDRFVPPVAGAVPLAVAASQPFGFDEGSPLRPCDTPGSGCRNFTSPGPLPPIVVQAPPPIFGGRIPPSER